MCSQNSFGPTISFQREALLCWRSCHHSHTKHGFTVCLFPADNCNRPSGRSGIFKSQNYSAALASAAKIYFAKSQYSPPSTKIASVLLSTLCQNLCGAIPSVLQGRKLHSPKIPSHISPDSTNHKTFLNFTCFVLATRCSPCQRDLGLMQTSPQLQT